MKTGQVVEQSEHTCLLIKFDILYWLSSWFFKLIKMITQRSLFTDHHNRYYNNEKVCNIVKTSKM
jgi:hypothetical protein